MMVGQPFSKIFQSHYKQSLERSLIVRQDVEDHSVVVDHCQKTVESLHHLPILRGLISLWDSVYSPENSHFLHRLFLLPNYHTPPKFFVSLELAVAATIDHPFYLTQLMRSMHQRISA